VVFGKVRKKEEADLGGWSELTGSQYMECEKNSETEMKTPMDLGRDNGFKEAGRFEKGGGKYV